MRQNDKLHSTTEIGLPIKTSSFRRCYSTLFVGVDRLIYIQLHKRDQRKLPSGTMLSLQQSYRTSQALVRMQPVRWKVTHSDCKSLSRSVPKHSDCIRKHSTQLQKTRPYIACFGPTHGHKTPDRPIGTKGDVSPSVTLHFRNLIQDFISPA